LVPRGGQAPGAQQSVGEKTGTTTTKRQATIIRRHQLQIAVLVGVWVLMATAPCPAAVRHPELARKAYLHAMELQRKLEARPARSRKAADYEHVIREFRNVYFYDFAYTKAPLAAETIGDLYAKMGRAFSDPDYFHAAIQAYQYVISEYPGSSMARDAALSVGKVYLNSLNDPQQAADAFRSFLEKHPSSAQSSEARKNLKAITHRLAANRSSSSSNPGDGLKPQASGGPVEVTEIHEWVGPNYTRVVIGGQGPFLYNTLRLSNPDRIVFDLPNTHLDHSLLKKIVPINGDFLRDIRVGQYKPDVTRIVLDVRNLHDYSAFPLPNPFRLIIDVHGSPAKMAKKTPEHGTAAAAPEHTVQAAVEETPPVAKRASEAKPEVVVTKRIEPAAKRTTEIASAKGIQQGAKRTAEVASNSRIQHAAKRTAETASSEPEPPPIPVSTKPASPTGNGSQTLTRALGLKVARIVIDPGHGGFDTGTIGPTGLEEKNVVLDIGLRLRKLIETQTDSQVVMTRSTDTFIPLEERTAIANEKDADLFISIHANASRDRQVRGIETYFLNFTTDPEALELAARENATSQESVHQLQNLIKKIALSDKIDESQELARDVQTVLYKDMSRVSHGIHNRGVRKAPFVVLIGANMPSVLAEISFLSNPHSEHLLREPAYREKIAKALFQGIEDYINNLGSVRVAQRTR